MKIYAKRKGHEPKKPRKMVLPKNHAKGVEAQLSIEPGQEIVEGNFWTYSPRDLRRLTDTEMQPIVFAAKIAFGKVLAARKKEQRP